MQLMSNCFLSSNLHLRVCLPLIKSPVFAIILPGTTTASYLVPEQNQDEPRQVNWIDGWTGGLVRGWMDAEKKEKEVGGGIAVSRKCRFQSKAELSGRWREKHRYLFGSFAL